MKKYNKEYIEKARKLIDEIINDKTEFDDWTQICFSMQDAVVLAATIWGRGTDGEIDNLRKFITEMSYREIENLNKFCITFKKKNQ